MVLNKTSSKPHLSQMHLLVLALKCTILRERFSLIKNNGNLTTFWTIFFFLSWKLFLFSGGFMWSVGPYSPTKGQTHATCSGSMESYHRTTREIFIMETFSLTLFLPCLQRVFQFYFNI